MGKSQEINKVKKLAALAPSSEPPPLKKTNIEIDVDDTDSTQAEDSEDQLALAAVQRLPTHSTRQNSQTISCPIDTLTIYAQAIGHE